MRATRKQKIPLSSMVAVSANTLAGILDCGRATAVKIGTDANARFQVGKRVLYNVEKVRHYLDTLAE
ncbi:hypothetical protein MUB23_00400 [Cuneatibacter sp. NSJ-177]|uniref:hypothetical protein n=1 Tax=Cuneatibacter sp. NSJ-177 TaxID=2931401 RepID=UPI001FD1E55C|nr:hypothetical protein [Cuneatibacter sp. NSJ-177]MCJ7833852.1 hypothetical protein [Cuneatibacter sp. NSJ-177]